jgi:DNA-binding transcriptional LysR family regulator
MANSDNLDMDSLRSFADGVAAGSFARAAGRSGRSASAISLRLKRLEEQTEQKLLRKQGRGLALTEAGEVMLAFARRILDLNDEALAALGEAARLEGRVRLGLAPDFAETRLPPLIGPFARLHPKVRLEVQVDHDPGLAQAIERGRFDLVLTWEPRAGAGRKPVARHRMAWIGPADFRWARGEPLPLVALDPPCRFRAAAVAALERKRIGWRQVLAAPGPAGLWAAIRCGLGATLRTTEGMPADLVVLDPAATGLPVPGRIDLVLLERVTRSERPAVARLRDLILDAFA